MVALGNIFFDNSVALFQEPIFMLTDLYLLGFILFTYPLVTFFGLCLKRLFLGEHLISVERLITSITPLIKLVRLNVIWQVFFISQRTQNIYNPR